MRLERWLWPTKRFRNWSREGRNGLGIEGNAVQGLVKWPQSWQVAVQLFLSVFFYLVAELSELGTTGDMSVGAAHH
jgi:hypothetical protein